MFYIIIFSIIIVSDQLAKYYFDKKIELGTFKEVIKNKFYFANIKNTGAAYGLLNKNPILLKLISIFSIILVCTHFIDIFKEDKSKNMRFALAFILGGAFSNVFDRFKRKSVTDYLYIKIKKAPIFNIADVFVLFGSLMLVCKSILDTVHKK